MVTLLTDLTRVAKYIRNERLRKLLLDKDKGKEGEHGGIGTPAPAWPPSPPNKSGAVCSIARK